MNYTLKSLKKRKKKTEECLNNIHIRFPMQENECYVRQTQILCTMEKIIN